jgi:GntR family transcriptional regulator
MGSSKKVVPAFRGRETAMAMLTQPNASSGVPIYLQLIEQVKHAVETGALRPGEQLPAIRHVAEQLVINPNTVAKAYRELQHDGIIELRHGSGAFVAENTSAKKVASRLRDAQAVVAKSVERLRSRGVTDEEIRRLYEAELAGVNRASISSGGSPRG